jgi:hypothetical protein
MILRPCPMDFTIPRGFLTGPHRSITKASLFEKLIRIEKYQCRFWRNLMWQSVVRDELLDELWKNQRMGRHSRQLSAERLNLTVASEDGS